jgi:hypothetical protein
MSDLFAYSSTFNEDISRWNLASVKTTRRMLHRAFAFEGHNFSNWNVASVTDMSNMFSSAKTFAQVLCWDDLHPHVILSQMFCDSQGSFDPNCTSSGGSKSSSTTSREVEDETSCKAEAHAAPSEGGGRDSMAQGLQRLAVIAIGVTVIFLPFLLYMTFDIAKSKWRQTRRLPTIGRRRSMAPQEGDEDTIAESETSSAPEHSQSEIDIIEQQLASA